MLRTRTGYAGGTAQKPTYKNIGDHTECVEVDYDPALITYEELLDEFWTMHSGKNHGYRGRQYLSLILYRTPAEKETAEEKRNDWQERKGTIIETEISEMNHFTRAENYHQKYFLRRFAKALKPVRDYAGNEEEFTDFVLAAKLNALAHGDLALHEIREGIPFWTTDIKKQQEWNNLLQQMKW